MIEKSSAHYQEIPRAHMRCGNCSMMRGSHCTLVRGVSNRNGWCNYWMPSEISGFHNLFGDDPNLVK